MFWDTCLDLSRLRLTGHRITTLGRPIRVQFSDKKVKRKLQQQLKSHLGNFQNETDLDVAWKDVRTVADTQASFIGELNQRVTKNQ